MSPFKNAKQINLLVQIIALELALLSLLNRFLGVIHPVECKITCCEVAITNHCIWFQSQRLSGFSHSLLVLPKLCVNASQVAGRHQILRIALGPQFVHLAGLLNSPVTFCVVQGSDTVFFMFADPVAQCISLLDILRSQAGLSEITVRDP